MYLLLSFHSLLKALTSSSKKTSGTQNAKLTDGIDIKSWKVVAPDKGEIIYSAWDFAGQTVYYNTHQVTLLAVFCCLGLFIDNYCNSLIFKLTELFSFIMECYS